MRNTDLRGTIVITVVAAAAALGLSAASPALAETGDCGQPQSTGAGPKTADALATLKSAVGSPSACDAEPCVCDVNGNGSVTSSDALRVLQKAVGQGVTLACDCSCTTLEAAAGLAPTSIGTLGIDAVSPQIQIEVRFLAVDTDSAVDLGIEFDLMKPLQTDAGPPRGGTSDSGTNLAVSTNAAGGPPDLDYFLYADHRADGALPVLNKNFVSPFQVSGVKTFFQLPTTGCIVFDESATSIPQNFPGGAPVVNLAPFDAGYGGDEILYDIVDGDGLDALINLVKSDGRNSFYFALTSRAHSGQAMFHMIDDIEPSIGQVVDDVRTNIQAVTPLPFGNFTGPTLDVTPRIGTMGTVDLDVRLGTELISFFFSTAFQVEGVNVDAEIPVLRRSLNKVSFTAAAGESVVLGGLLRDGQQDPDIGLPILGDIPLIGDAFTRKRLDAEKQKLILVITPTIIGDP